MVILDISMPNSRWYGNHHDIKAVHSKTKVLILTVHNQAPYVHQAMAEGADGYVVQEDSGAELISAIEAIRKGKVHISQRLRDKVGDPWQGSLGDTGQLSTREQQVLKHIAEGKSNREIAALLYVSVRTVESHRANIMRKLKLKKTANLVRFAFDHGFG
jgi:DNA-binding NarL/FixJ family response regulator